jgi:hypothetical protein
VAAREVVDFAVVAFLAGAFFAVARVPGAVDRVAVAFFAGAFFAVDFAPTVFFTADFAAVERVAVERVAVDFAGVDLAGVARFAGAFFAAVFFTAPAARVAAVVAFFRAVAAFDATVFFAVVAFAVAFFAGALLAGAFFAVAGRVAVARVAAVRVPVARAGDVFLATPVLLRAAVVFFAPVVLRADVVFAPVRLAAGRLVAFTASAIWVLLAGHALGGLLVETAESFDDAGSAPRRYLSSPAQRASSASHSSLRCRTFSSACSASCAEAYGPRT